MWIVCWKTIVGAALETKSTENLGINTRHKSTEIQELIQDTHRKNANMVVSLLQKWIG